MTDDAWLTLRAKLTRAFGEDVAQEACLRLWQAPSVTFPWSWAYQVGRRLQIDQARAQRPTTPVAPDTVVTLLTPERETLARVSLQRACPRRLAWAARLGPRCQRTCCRPSARVAASHAPA